MKNNFFSDRRGQTIVEVMVALSILTVGLTGLLSLLSQSFYLDRVISDQTKATYLAEEGVELAKSLIDNDVYVGAATNGSEGGWGSCFGLGLRQSQDYELDYTSMPTSPSNRPCSLMLFQGNGDPLHFNVSTGLYSYNNIYPATNFTRRIRVTLVTASEFDVQSVVTWSTGALTSQSIDLEDTFYNWYP